MQKKGRIQKYGVYAHLYQDDFYILIYNKSTIEKYSIKKYA